MGLKRYFRFHCVLIYRYDFNYNILNLGYYIKSNLNQNKHISRNTAVNIIFSYDIIGYDIYIVKDYSFSDNF